MRNAYRWYVYQLVDPRTQMPFYIGKGSGNRINAHEREAVRGVCSRKTKLIKEITNDGFLVEKSYLAWFCDEQAAYDHETDVIEMIGLGNLTNVLPGGQKAWVRRVEERAKRDRVAKKSPWYVGAYDLLEMFFDWLKVGGSEGKFVVTDGSATGVRHFCAEEIYTRICPEILASLKADPEMKRYVLGYAKQIDARN